MFVAQLNKHTLYRATHPVTLYHATHPVPHTVTSLIALGNIKHAWVAVQDQLVVDLAVHSQIVCTLTEGVTEGVSIMYTYMYVAAHGPL